MNAHFAGIGAFALAPARETYPGLQLVVANSFRDLCVTLVQAAGTQRSRGVCVCVCLIRMFLNVVQLRKIFSRPM
jgi:hypothetical protein